MTSITTTNAAYDLSLFDPERKSINREKNFELYVNRRATVNKGLMTRLTIIAIAFAILTSVFLFNCALLNEETSRLGSLRKEYAEIVKENELLNLEFENKYNINNMEALASEKYGLTRYRPEKIVYVYAEEEDSVEIVEESFGRKIIEAVTLIKGPFASEK